MKLFPLIGAKSCDFFSIKISVSIHDIPLKIFNFFLKSKKKIQSNNEIQLYINVE